MTDKSVHKITVDAVRKKKGYGTITMLTCYDYSFARILDATKLDIILVGDSMANVVLGLDQTRKITFSEMLSHTKAVSVGVKRALVVADMPYVSYQKKPQRALYFAERFLQAGAQAVKIEWFAGNSGSDCVGVIKSLIKHKVPVMGHIGLTPQTAHLLGGYKVQGRDKKCADTLIHQAKILEHLGVFSIVLECMPFTLARTITASLRIPTISCGAGKYCDGQVLVLYDLLGLYRPSRPLKFVRVFGDLDKHTLSAVNRFVADTRNLRFPTKEESFL